MSTYISARTGVKRELFQEKERATVAATMTL